jgi:DNA-binding LytR/AlgR family response regulator
VPYECDGLTAYRELPLAVVLPETEAQLSAVLATCHRLGVPVVARGEQLYVLPASDASGDTDDSVRFSLSGGRGFETVAYADIVWVEAVRNYTRVQARDRRPRIIRRTMSEWESMLPVASFGRVSRSLIVQLSEVRSMQWQSRDQTLVFFVGATEPLPIGRAATTRLKDLLAT